MSAEPTTNDFLELIDWHIAKAQDRAARAVNEVRGKAAAAGRFQSSATAIHSIERARTEFDVGVDAVLGELKRVAQSTKLNRDDLRQLAVQRLEELPLLQRRYPKRSNFGAWASASKSMSNSLALIGTYSSPCGNSTSDSEFQPNRRSPPWRTRSPSER